MKSRSTSSASATPAPEAPAEPPKRPRGRPPGPSSPKTPAERQNAYRARQHAAAQDAYGAPQGKPTHVVLASLGQLLAQLDNPDRAADHASVRSLAGLAVGELCARYGLHPKLPSQ